MPEPKMTSNFWTTLTAMVAVITPASIILWMLLTSHFVLKDEYSRQKEEQAVINQRVETSLESINRQIKSVDTTMQTLNTTLKMIQEQNQPARLRR